MSENVAASDGMVVDAENVTEEAVVADVADEVTETEETAPEEKVPEERAPDETGQSAGAAETQGSEERVGSLDLEGEVAADYLEELLDIADLDGDIDTYTEGGRAHVSVVTDAEVLVGRDGAVLDALQELSRLAVMTETGRRSRLMLDIAGHRDRRRTELRALAADTVQSVKETGESARLAPMNPFERKIVHDAVAEAGLGSESEGEEPQRRVVVLPA